MINFIHKNNQDFQQGNKLQTIQAICFRHENCVYFYTIPFINIKLFYLKKKIDYHIGFNIQIIQIV